MMNRDIEYILAAIRLKVIDGYLQSRRQYAYSLTYHKFQCMKSFSNKDRISAIVRCLYIEAGIIVIDPHDKIRTLKHRAPIHIHNSAQRSRDSLKASPYIHIFSRRSHIAPV